MSNIDHVQCRAVRRAAHAVDIRGRVRALSPFVAIALLLLGADSAIAQDTSEPSGFTKISALGVEEQRVNTIIDFDDPPESRPSIGDGYRVEVRIIVAARENVLKVPVSSLIRHGAEWAVYLVEDDRAARRVVQIGERNGLEAEITNGLSGGERIIVYPSDAIADGVKVAPRS